MVEDRRPVTPGDALPCCDGGQGACPPEDCGGPWGYDSLKEALADPRHEEHADMLEWMGLDSGAEFDATEFSLDEANARLGSLNRPA